MPPGSIGVEVRGELTKKAIDRLMKEIARHAPGGRSYRVFFVGGGTAVISGWRGSTIDADLHADDESVLRDIQAIKERLQVNVELARPEDFVPAIAGTRSRHVFIETIGRVSFYHYDPYAQLLSKVVRGFRKDMLDAESFIASGLVEPARFRSLVHEIPETAYARYPALSHRAVLEAVDDSLAQLNDNPSG